MDSFSFKGNHVKQKKYVPKSDYISALVVWKKDKIKAFYKGEYYDLVYDITKYKTVYSLPSNTKYPEWTKKTVDSVNPAAYLFWSPFKNKAYVKGQILNNSFIIK